MKRIALFLDSTFRNGPMNMALDEAIVHSVKQTGAVLRLYRWAEPWRTYGYFVHWERVAELQPQTKAVRRWTGGGIVGHGHDLTYSLILPPTQAPIPSTMLYAQVHRALAFALQGIHGSIALVDASTPVETTPAGRRALSSDSCFANPVISDLVLAGKKVAGAALRRHRTAVLLQGSIQGLAIPPDLGASFAAGLADQVEPFDLLAGTLALAERLAGEKYGSLDWNRKF